MRRIVERLTWSRARSTWSNYAQCNTYEQADRERKKRFILRAAASAPRSCVWDLGCNTGEYSRAPSVSVPIWSSRSTPTIWPSSTSTVR